MPGARRIPGSAEPDNLGSTRTLGPIQIAGRQLSIIASWTGTPTGTFELEGSVDGVTWYPIPGAAAEFTANGQAQPAGAAGSAAWTWLNIPATQVRLRYTRTSGTGTFTGHSVQAD